MIASATVTANQAIKFEIIIIIIILNLHQVDDDDVAIIIAVLLNSNSCSLVFVNNVVVVIVMTAARILIRLEVRLRVILRSIAIFQELGGEEHSKRNDYGVDYDILRILLQRPCLKMKQELLRLGDTRIGCFGREEMLFQDCMNLRVAKALSVDACAPINILLEVSSFFFDLCAFELCSEFNYY